MTVLYTKYNALWTKHSLKIYWEVWKSESGKVLYNKVLCFKVINHNWVSKRIFLLQMWTGVRRHKRWCTTRHWLTVCISRGSRITSRTSGDAKAVIRDYRDRKPLWNHFSHAQASVSLNVRIPELKTGAAVSSARVHQRRGLDGLWPRAHSTSFQWTFDSLSSQLHNQTCTC